MRKPLPGTSRMIDLFEPGVKSSFRRGLGWNAADRTLTWVYFFTQFLEDGLDCDCDCISYFFKGFYTLLIFCVSCGRV